MLGIDKPFLFQTTNLVIKTMRETYPELEDHQQFIATIVQQEEERFIHTLERGMAVLDEILAKTLKMQSTKIVSGEEIFRLYDTFGFPVDIAQDILKENGLEFDQQGFNAAMEQQRQMARQSWQGMGSVDGKLKITPLLQELTKTLSPTKFVGYSVDQSSAKVLAILRNGKRLNKANQNEEVDIILDQTPFYGEKGGQVSDRGLLKKKVCGPSY